MSEGQIVQCIGAVVDIQFPRDQMPRIYEALKLQPSAGKSLAEEGLTFEVQQQLGDGIVRTIAMGSSDGLRRGMPVSSTGKGISVPVGPEVLGRVMDVLGRPIDERGPINASEYREIHQAAPKFDELAPPKRPTLPPLANGQIRSITLMPVSSSSCDGASSSNFGAA